MNVLVLNAGSSSLKFQLMNTKTREVFTKGNCERIGLTDGIFGHVEGDGEKVKEIVDFPDHGTAIRKVIELINEHGFEMEAFGHRIVQGGWHFEDSEKVKEIVDFPDHGTAIRKVIELINEHGFEMEAFGHRIVQGGWHFEDSALVDDEVLAKIYEVAPLAPLHNYAEAGVIEHCRETYPELPRALPRDLPRAPERRRVRHVLPHGHAARGLHLRAADRGAREAAHPQVRRGMPPAAYTYALPTEVREKLHIRKYGAHGTSHRYEWQTAKELLGETCQRVLSCHLGNGSSLCAIEDGVVRDTTMGLTPLDGLLMGTRCGSIDPATVCYLQREGGYTCDEVDTDPATVCYLQREGGYTCDEVDTMMNKQSGFLAISENTSDARGRLHLR